MIKHFHPLIKNNVTWFQSKMTMLPYLFFAFRLRLLIFDSQDVSFSKILLTTDFPTRLDKEEEEKKKNENSYSFFFAIKFFMECSREVVFFVVVIIILKYRFFSSFFFFLSKSFNKFTWDLSVCIEKFFLSFVSARGLLWEVQRPFPALAK